MSRCAAAMAALRDAISSCRSYVACSEALYLELLLYKVNVEILSPVDFTGLATGLMSLELSVSALPPDATFWRAKCKRISCDGYGRSESVTVNKGNFDVCWNTANFPKIYSRPIRPVAATILMAIISPTSRLRSLGPCSLTIEESPFRLPLPLPPCSASSATHSRSHPGGQPT